MGIYLALLWGVLVTKNLHYVTPLGGEFSIYDMEIHIIVQEFLNRGPYLLWNSIP